MEDFLERLADREILDPPPNFGRRLHQQLNRTLLAQHIVDFFAGAIAWSVVHFLRAAFAWLLFTVTGKYPDRDRR